MMILKDIQSKKGTCFRFKDDIESGIRITYMVSDYVSEGSMLKSLIQLHNGSTFIMDQEDSFLSCEVIIIPNPFEGEK